MSLAKAMISGTVTSDPEKRFTPNNVAVTSFTLSVASPGPSGGNRDQGPFLVKITCWRGLADAAAEQIRKGDHILVDGKLSINSYQTPEGVQKKNYEIDATSLSKLPGEPQTILAAPGSEEGGSRAPRQEGAGYTSAPAPALAAAKPAGSMMTDELLTEDDIPF